MLQPHPRLLYLGFEYGELVGQLLAIEFPRLDLALHFLNLIFKLSSKRGQGFLVLDLHEIHLMVLFLLELDHSFLLKGGLLEQLILIHTFLIPQFFCLGGQLPIDDL